MGMFGTKNDEEGDEQERKKLRLLEESLFRRLYQRIRETISSADYGPEGSEASKLPPFSIPPSKYDINIFGRCNPFVEVVVKPGVESWDKVSRAKKSRMNCMVLARIAEELLFTSFESRMLCPHAKTELGFRDVHISLIKSLVRLVKKNLTKKQTLLKCEQLKQTAERNKKRKRLSDEEEKNEGFYIQLQSLEGDHVPVGLEALYEGDEGGNDNDKSRFDMKVLIHDKRIQEDDDLVAVANIECKKFNEDLAHAVSQAGFYAIKDVLLNMQKGRYSPVYSFGFANTKWKYGMLVPFGVVTVKNGFVKGFKTINENITQEFLDGTLQEATIALRKKFPWHRRYPDGQYLSGVLYCDDEEYDLPGEGCKPEDAALFYQSWLQIIAGNEVYDWTLGEVEKRLKERDAEILRKCAAIGDALRKLN